MAVTRINNNQVSDASTGNVYVGINAAVKLQNYSVTSTKLANNLTYASDLTVTGNLTIQGNTTTVDTTYTTIEDPTILLASNQTGPPTVDIGFVGERGTSNNIAFVWDESATEFVTVFASSAESNTTIAISSYANLHTNDSNVGGNLKVNGTTSLVGNVLGNININGNVNAANGCFTSNVTVIGTLTSTSNIVANSSGIFYGNTVTGNGAIYAGVPGYTFLGSDIVMQVTGNANNYSQINFQNINPGSRSSTDFVLTADNGNDSVNFFNMGITGSTWDGTQPNSLGNALRPNDGYLYADSGNVVIGTVVPLDHVRIVVGGASNSYVVAEFHDPQTAATSTTTGTLTVNGGIGANGNIYGNIISGTGNIVSSANVSGGNVIATTTVSAPSHIGTIVSVTANVTGGNLLTGGLISATGNVTSAANVAGGNLVATTAVVTPTVIGTTVTVSSTGGLITLAPSSNISVSNKYINNMAQPVQDNDAASKIYVDNMTSTALAYHTAVVAATTGTLETATGGTITYAQPNGAGNGVGATLTVAGGTFNLIDTANIQTANTRVLVKNQANAALNGVYIWSNATVLTRSTDADTYGPNSSTDLSLNDYFFVTGGLVNEGSAWVVDAPSGAITFGTSNITFAQFSSSQVYEANTSAGLSLTGTTFSAKVDNNTTAFDGGGNIIVKASANLTTPNIGAATGTSVSVTGNVTGGNLNTGGQVVATANITGGNLLTSGLVSAASHIGSVVSVTANITGGNLLTGGLVSATGTITSAANITGGNLLTSGLVSAASHIGSVVSVTANITGGNLLTGGLISSTGNITSAANISGANVLGTNISASGNITGANINTGGLNGLTLNGANINSNAGRITINQIDADVDFAVDGSGLGNIFYVDAGTRTVSFGNSTQTTNAIVAMNATNSFLMPVGNTAQRPGVGVTGMLRFNSTLDAVEVYDADGWATVGTPSFTVISDQQFNGDGVTVAFTLAAAATTNSVIVSINGVVQIPTIAYSVSSTTLTFTEAPQTGDLIDVRNITTTTQVTSISNSPGNAIIGTNPLINEVSVTGNLVPTGNATQSLGSPTNYWKSLYVAGNTIYLGGLQLTASGSTFTVFQSDGTTPAAANTTINTTNSITVGGILNAGANGVGNIGNATTYFNTVFAKATSAQYADLAENYVADAAYAPGTVLSFGGDKEVTRTELAGDRRIAGVVSTNPSYIMNSTVEGEFIATVALTGRVPTKVLGPVAKGDMMVAGGNGIAVACATPAMGTVIGKALEEHVSGYGTIEVVVGRL